MHTINHNAEGVISNANPTTQPMGSPSSSSSCSSSCSLYNDGTVTRRPIDDEKLNKQKLESSLKEKLQSGISDCKIKDIRSTHDNTEHNDDWNYNEFHGTPSISSMDETASSNSSPPFTSQLVNNNKQNQAESARNKSENTVSSVQNIEVPAIERMSFVDPNKLAASYKATAVHVRSGNNVFPTGNVIQHSIPNQMIQQIVYPQPYYNQNNSLQIMNPLHGMSGSLLTGTLQPMNHMNTINNMNIHNINPLYVAPMHQYDYNVQTNECNIEKECNPPRTPEDYHWLCYHYRSSGVLGGNKYSCKFGSGCRWRHYDFELRVDDRTQWHPSTSVHHKYRLTMKQLAQARQRMKTLQKQYKWLMDEKQKHVQTNNDRKIEGNRYQRIEDDHSENIVFTFDEMDINVLRAKIALLMPLTLNKEKNKEDLKEFRMRICSLVQTLNYLQKKMDNMI